ncbi:unnamed protein product [Arabidopsis thaliana]|uniref:TF-B3 domain-containing protein n=1 Tax=Arabidopsis thaliana TaxID=3702 RepID=A0A654EVU9_ARATH|nr:unnamed protein product [Arabidopsis thaliana]
MELNSSDLGTSRYENRDLPAPRSNNNQDKTGDISRKKHQRQVQKKLMMRTTPVKHVRKKKMKRSKTETEVDASLSDHSSFVALVTASNLHNDALYLPQDLTSSVGLKRKFREIVVTDERERLWALDLRFDKSFDSFYISRGWRSLCDEIGKKAGSVFVFKVVDNGKTLVLSFGSTESIHDGIHRHKNNNDTCMERKSKKKRMRCRDSTSPSQNRCVTLKLTHDNLIKSRRYLPLSFTRANGLEPGIITLVGKDGTKLEATLRRENTGLMCLGNGWKDFSISNGLKSGKSFTLELILENGTPMLSLVSTQSTSHKSQKRECSKHSEKESISAVPSKGKKNRKARSNREERRDSSSAIQNRFVTFTPEDIRDCILILPCRFMKANGINNFGKITLLGQNRMKWFAYLLSKDGSLALGSGWKGFCEANGVKTGESLTLEYIDEQETAHVLKFCSKSVE